MNRDQDHDPDHEYTPGVVVPARRKNARVVYEEDASPEWYTPAALRALALSVLGSVDFDPATCSENPLRARRFLTLADGPPCVSRWLEELGAADMPQPSGLFLNPPYGRRKTPRWLELLAELYRELSGTAAIVNALVLVPCRPGTHWYEQATGPEGFDLVCELRGRVCFDHRDARGLIVPGKVSARWASVLLYRSGAVLSAEALGSVRRKLARLGQVRLCGRARRARAHVSHQASLHVDARQTALLWPANVHPLERRRT